MTFPPWRSVLTALESRLTPGGLDLIAPAQVGWYNRSEPAAVRLPEPSGPASLAVVVGNSVAMWRPFLQGVRDDPGLLAGEHPLDAWVERQVLDAVAELATQPLSIHWVNGPGSRSFSMQRAAAATGLVGMAPCRLTIHRRVGLWFGLRAVLVFRVDGPAEPLWNAPFPCASCADQPCLPLLERALGAAVDGAEAPAMLGVRRHWQPWLAMRDSCPHGREHRYGELQLGYHYSKQRQYLMEALG